MLLQLATTKFCCVTIFEVGGNTANNAFQLATQQCCNNVTGPLVSSVSVTKLYLITVLFCYSRSALLASDKQNTLVTKQRKIEVEKNQKVYKWGTDPNYVHDLPGFIEGASSEDLPKDVQFADEASNALFSTARQSLINLGLGAFFGLFQQWDSFDDFRKCITPVIGDVPPAADRWRDDVWFGSQFLNGCNPDMITRCDALPEKFPVTDEMVGNMLDRGTTLEQNITVLRF